METRHCINNQLHPRMIAQRTSELNCNLRGYSRYLYRCRCQERLRKDLSERIGHALFRYALSRQKHPAYRVKAWGSIERRWLKESSRHCGLILPSP